MRLVIPMALFSPESVEAAILICAPAVIALHNGSGYIFSAGWFTSELDLAGKESDMCHLRGRGKDTSVELGILRDCQAGLRILWKVEAGRRWEVETIGSWLSSAQNQGGGNEGPDVPLLRNDLLNRKLLN